jgi:hypothetical protein
LEESLFLIGSEFELALAAQNRAPFLVIGDRHAALDAHPGALNGLAGFATKDLLQKRHGASWIRYELSDMSYQRTSRPGAEGRKRCAEKLLR